MGRLSADLLPSPSNFGERYPFQTFVYLYPSFHYAVPGPGNIHHDVPVSLSNPFPLSLGDWFLNGSYFPLLGPVLMISASPTGSGTYSTSVKSRDVSSEMAPIWRRLHAARGFVLDRARRRRCRRKLEEVVPPVNMGQPPKGIKIGCVVAEKSKLSFLIPSKMSHSSFEQNPIFWR